MSRVCVQWAGPGCSIRKGSNTMKRTAPSGTRHSSTIDTRGLVSAAWRDVAAGLDRLRVMAGIDAVQRMMNEDAADLAGERCGRDAGKPGHRRGRASGMVGFRGGRIRLERPRTRDRETGRELPLPGREEIRDGGCPGQWATSPMLVNGQARRLRSAVRLKEAAAPDDHGSGRSRSAVSRRHRGTGRGEAPPMDVIGHPGA